MSCYWDKLTAGGDKNSQVCGWLKDKFGLSWQIVPAVLPNLIHDKDPAGSQRVVAALLKMKKLDIKALQEAYDGKVLA
jgi:predicted 3-demethylubiquinone-9 3-methyltransferase (glyoxalase superfamily)